MEYLGAFCILAFGFPIFSALWVATGCIIRRKWFWLWVASALPVFMLLFISFVTICSHLDSQPAAIFQSSFGFAPTPDVKIINTFRSGPMKWTDAFIEFEADEAIIQRILGQGYKPLRENEINPYGLSENRTGGRRRAVQRLRFMVEKSTTQELRTQAIC